VLSAEATNINFIVFGFSQQELEPMIYHTRGEHANHYATDEVHHFIPNYLNIAEKLLSWH
jgi:hypothetical protein